MNNIIKDSNYIQREEFKEKIDMVSRMDGRFKDTGLVMPKEQFSMYQALKNTFMETVKAMHPYFVARMLGGAMVVAGQVLLAYNVWQTARAAIHARQHVTATLAPQEAI